MKTDLEEIKGLINEAKAIVIGAGSGLSAAAGFEYGGKAFKDNFEYMAKKYHVHDMYSAGFAPFESEEEFWGYWSKFIYLERYKDGAKPLYQELLRLMHDKNYFVITTNVDHQFQLAGFNKSRLFYTQGDYGLFQSTNPKNNHKTYDNEKTVREMVENTDPNTHEIPSYLIPVCPDDGYKMTTNLRCDDSFVQDDGWYKAYDRYEKFLSENRTGEVLYLELGVGYNTPVIIKYPFWKFTYSNPEARYVTVGLGDQGVPQEIKDRSYVLNMDLKEFTEVLL